MEVAQLHHDLLAWGDSARRELPWRFSRDPWRVLVSEFMLQQTQVSRVVPKFEAFVSRFPTVTDCADGSVGEIIELWVGLGYNRRAVNLHRSAVVIAMEHNGGVPSDLVSLLDLPGVGPYTARAVLTFGFGMDVGIVDTNVARVLARWAGAPLNPRELQARADELIPPGQSWEWNQTLLDLGASICKAKTFSCRSCPVRQHCRWRSSGPDPASRSSAQSQFEGSDRQGRGRLVEEMRFGPVNEDDLAKIMGWPADPERARQVAQTLVADGLAVEAAPGVLSLPHRSNPVRQ